MDGSLPGSISAEAGELRLYWSVQVEPNQKWPFLIFSYVPGGRQGWHVLQDADEEQDRLDDPEPNITPGGLLVAPAFDCATIQGQTRCFGDSEVAGVLRFSRNVIASLLCMGGRCNWALRLQVYAFPLKPAFSCLCIKQNWWFHLYKWSQGSSSLFMLKNWLWHSASCDIYFHYVLAWTKSPNVYWSVTLVYEFFTPELCFCYLVLISFWFMLKFLAFKLCLFQWGNCKR